VLAQLFEAARLDALGRQETVPNSTLEKRIAGLPKPPDVFQSLAPTNRMRLIAEIKRSSPSKGEMAKIEDPGALAIGYQSSGADAISVLTERTGFSGSLSDLEAVSSAVTIPVLRKDFISIDYQVLEARAAGASFILLILAHLDDAKAKSLAELAGELGMGVLVETHTDEEVSRAIDLGSRLIGINTRDLRTFVTDLSLFEKLSGRLDGKVIKVAESSVKNVDDVMRYRSAGADVVLVGEALVTGDWAKLIPQITAIS
jgi:indole-3-glycerol phosphate synthase